jgi:hypothetical protein
MFLWEAAWKIETPERQCAPMTIVAWQYSEIESNDKQVG